MACTYCYIETEPDRSAHMMSEDRACRAVEYFFRYSHRAPFHDIIFYGGEPLLNSRAVFAAAGRAKELTLKTKDDSQLTLRLVTNGLLVDAPLASELARQHIDVVLSIDGPREVHDQYRRTVRGARTFTRVTRAFRLLRKQGLEPTISFTVTPSALEDWDHVLSFITEELQPRTVVFNPLLPAPGADAQDKIDDAMPATAALIQAYERLQSHRIHEDRVGRRADHFQSMRFRYKDCPGTAGQVAITPEGAIGPCQGLLGDPTYFPLHLDRDFDRSPFEHPLFEEWFDRFPLSFDECIDCPAISICGGGCAISALRDNGSIWHVDQRVCNQVKPIHEWLTWKNFTATAKQASMRMP